MSVEDVSSKNPETGNVSGGRDQICRWIYLAAGVGFVAGLAALVRYVPVSDLVSFWGVAIVVLFCGSLIACLPYASRLSLFLEMNTIALTWLVFNLQGHCSNPICYLPFVAALLACVSYPVLPRLSPILSTFLSAAWLILSGCASEVASPIGCFYLAATLTMLALFWSGVVLLPRRRPEHIDLLVSSYSANTAHFAGAFSDGACRAGAKVTIHRFHYYRCFTARFDGDALAVAFPVIGWKPPWPLLYYLVLKLPFGGGKPAYVLYTAAGGPENAGAFVWLLLLFKGYRVAGRSWSVYPLNVPMMRLGPKSLWRWLDSLLPYSRDISAVTADGARFVEGGRAGLPLIFWPFFLWLFGVVTDNPLINLIYRNHVFKSRCQNCGLCVSYCPSERLQIVDGRLRVRGTCALCMGCINTCPTGAMQMWLISEYGVAYLPKWPALLVKKGSE
jgi:NAD-dependent dihydropyrimidine dehydrogenase PreA subunit